MNLRAPRLHESYELVEEIPAIVGPRSGLRMVLDREDRLVHMSDTFDRPVIEIDVCQS